MGTRDQPIIVAHISTVDLPVKWKGGGGNTRRIDADEVCLMHTPHSQNAFNNGFVESLSR